MSKSPFQKPPHIAPEEIGNAIACAHHLRALAARTVLLKLGRAVARAFRAVTRAPFAAGCKLISTKDRCTRR
ncbi:MAG: hypothetical protein JJU09_09875 [Rhodobacteraceae bacterium]|nr:hypothetical protein [Paracoccaceae bacterium]MCC5966631.1 hypothetical protein [Natronohydrobacter sp.]